MKIFATLCIVFVGVSGLLACQEVTIDQESNSLSIQIEESELNVQERVERKRQEQREMRSEAFKLAKAHEAERKAHAEELIHQRKLGASSRQEFKASELEIKRLVSEYQSTEDEAIRKSLENEIRDELTDAYIIRLDAYDDKVSQLKKKMEMMELQLESHRDAMEEMIDLRLKTITKATDPSELLDGGQFQRFARNRPEPEAFPKRLLDEGAEIPEGPEEPTTPSYPDLETFNSDGESSSGSGKVFFASENKLKNGQLILIEANNPKHRSRITFGGERDSIGVTLTPGRYSYTYKQDGEVWGRGVFTRTDAKRQYIEIESGESATHMLDQHKVAVKFKTKSPMESANIFVQGIDNDFSANEFTGDFSGEQEFKYLPGNYIFVFSCKGYKSIKNFSVKAGEPLTIDVDQSQRK